MITLSLDLRVISYKEFTVANRFETCPKLHSIDVFFFETPTSHRSDRAPQPKEAASVHPVCKQDSRPSSPTTTSEFPPPLTSCRRRRDHRWSLAPKNRTGEASFPRRCQIRAANKLPPSSSFDGPSTADQTERRNHIDVLSPSDQLHHCSDHLANHDEPIDPTKLTPLRSDFPVFPIDADPQPSRTRLPPIQASARYMSLAPLYSFTY